MSNWYQPFSWGASITSSQRSGYIEQGEVILKILQRHYNTKKQGKEIWSILATFLIQAHQKNKKLTVSQLADAIIDTYTDNGKNYPDNFDIDKALFFIEHPKEKFIKQNESISQTYTLHWYQQKSEEVENHLKHIALMKLQLTKNLKDLQSQNGGHLWIDTDFIDPATETLQASLTQIQDLENRLQVLKLTYQDHL